jgi:hypothetical protein
VVPGNAGLFWLLVAVRSWSQLASETQLASSAQQRTLPTAVGSRHCTVVTLFCGPGYTKKPLAQGDRVQVKKSPVGSQEVSEITLAANSSTLQSLKPEGTSQGRG